MNLWQALNQVRWKLRNAVWPTAGTVVWGNDVYVTAGTNEQALASMSTPAIIVKPLNGSNDPDGIEEPAYMTTNIAVRMICAVVGDPMGENSLLGANRVSETTSEGAGLLELEERLYSEMSLLSHTEGMVVQLRAQDATVATIDEELGHVTWRDYQFEILHDIDEFYPAGRKFTATDAGGGNATLAWTSPGERFDSRRVVVRRASGATAPATPEAGTSVTNAAWTSSGVTDNAGPGQFSYSVFWTYDKRSLTPDSDDYSSAALSATVTVTT